MIYQQCKIMQAVQIIVVLWGSEGDGEPATAYIIHCEGEQMIRLNTRRRANCRSIKKQKLSLVDCGHAAKWTNLPQIRESPSLWPAT